MEDGDTCENCGEGEMIAGTFRAENGLITFEGFFCASCDIFVRKD